MNTVGPVMRQARGGKSLDDISSKPELAQRELAEDYIEYTSRLFPQ